MWKCVLSLFQKQFGKTHNYWAPLFSACGLPLSPCLMDVLSSLPGSATRSAGNLHKLYVERSRGGAELGHRLLGTRGDSWVRPPIWCECWLINFNYICRLQCLIAKKDDITAGEMWPKIVQCWCDWWRQLLKYNLGLIFSELQSRELWQQIKISDHFLKYPPNEFWFCECWVSQLKESHWAPGSQWHWHEPSLNRPTLSGARSRRERESERLQTSVRANNSWEQEEN